MPSEYTPGGSGARMTNAQIRKLQKNQKLARELAAKNLAAAKKSDEWKHEEEILEQLEEKLDTPAANTLVMEEKTEIIKLSFFQRIIQFFKNLFR